MYNNYNSNEEIIKSYHIRNFSNKDAKEIAQIIKQSILESNEDVCLLKQIESLVKDCSADKILEINTYSRIYVMSLYKKIVACGIVSKNLEEDGIVLTTFVLPQLQGKGVSQTIIKYLQKDDYYLNAKRMEIASAITACKHYKRMEALIKKELHHVSA